MHYSTVLNALAPGHFYYTGIPCNPTPHYNKQDISYHNAFEFFALHTFVWSFLQHHKLWWWSQSDCQSSAVCQMLAELSSQRARGQTSASVLDPYSPSLFLQFHSQQISRPLGWVLVTQAGPESPCLNLTRLVWTGGESQVLPACLPTCGTFHNLCFGETQAWWRGLHCRKWF